MEFILAYAAGLLTLINPCVLPVLPVVLAGALGANPKGPVALAAGMSTSFVLLGVFVTAFGRALGLTEQSVAQGGAVLMIAFGLLLLVPRMGAVFAGATAGMSARADAQMNELNQSSLMGQYAGGLLLGAVWSPCIGPTLGGAIALASQGESLGRATAIMVFFALGVSTLILALGYGTRAWLMRNRERMQRVALAARPAMGAVFVAVGLALLFNLHHMVEAWAVNALPAWLIDFSVSI
ncbi:cytochrome c biogenesis CcdA family protein [Lentibacter algarum]|uniref:cytochrome c biogenesis CcdA family protein n=1 Tax=Lentibacter algarum TaxID=576131 RepID=UPI001C06B99F|nr:cytochrome c biogenesis CcdA family protein [Lentibacter algarum]MBU2980546.1 cytochrome c biogenesis CcdA family protein [Lentibacter algarum]